jgi:asparagine synthase (glutamine-hydrolysing)
MCGITGKIDFEGAVDRDTLVRMCQVMEHRGPDARGIHLSDGVGIGAQRLAIIDVAHGDQPVYNEDRSVVAALNGEIYNFPELRERLLAQGHAFRSHVDTEVLVHLYEEHGDDMVDRLHGMFAFAVWDERRRRLLLARDRVGKKPLFWARRGSRVWFASELRSLLQDPELDRTVDPRAIDAYLALQYVPHPLSIFEGIRKLPPATSLAVDAGGERERRYWSLDYSRPRSGLGFDEAKEELRDQLRRATRRRLMSEVPLGAFLSGGVDSSAVVATMAGQMSEPVKTFSIGFPDRDFDEHGYARTIAERFSTDHHEFVVEPDALSIMPKLARHYGEPYGDASAIPSFYLAELTKAHVTVALNGDGADESFGGYTRYRANRLLGRVGWESPALQRAGAALSRALGGGSRENSGRGRAARVLATIGMAPADRYARWMSVFPPEPRARLLDPEFSATLRGFDPAGAIRSAWNGASGGDSLNAMLGADVATYLPDDLLVKMDIATMAYSVEARSPFLDHELMEFAAGLPADFKLDGSSQKRVLKEAFRGILPDEVMDRPKQGFAVPLRSWFRNELREMPGEVLLDPRALGRGYFRPGAVERLIAEHRDGAADHSLRLWVLLQLETWHREVAG